LLLSYFCRLSLIDKNRKVTITKAYFLEFPLNHFHKSIFHNHIIFLSQKAIEEAIQNFNEKTQSTTISDLYYSYPVRYLEEGPEGNSILATLENFPRIVKNRPYINEIDDDYDYLIAY
jgi:hypothetical protein